jgi:hypothetical protein
VEIRRRTHEVAGRWVYELVTSPDEDLVEHGRRVFEVDLPAGVADHPPHPDVHALALLLVVRPYSLVEVLLPDPVSAAFAEAVRRRLGMVVGPVDPHLSPRTPPAQGRPGLAFSAGVDSVAALTVLPEETVSYFLQRRDPAGAVHSQLTVEVPTAACAELAAMGREVRIVPTDLEHVRPRPGFPEHYANSVPALLCSELDQLDAIAWGVVAESAYRIGKTHFERFLDRRVNSRWHALFEAAGVPMLTPVLGVSEIGTTAICLDSPYGHLASSCVRGSLAGPCRRCWKCFRKGILEAGHHGRWPDGDLLDRQFHAHPVRAALRPLPIKHEVGLTWALASYDGSHELLRLLARRVRAGEDDVSFLEGWYPPSVETWPARYREPVAARLDALWPRMDPDQRRRFEAFDLRPRLESEADQRLARACGLLLDAHAEVFGTEPVKPSTEAGVDASEVDVLRRQVETLSARIEALEGSTSYRLGHRLVRSVAPLKRLKHR